MAAAVIDAVLVSVVAAASTAANVALVVRGHRPRPPARRRPRQAQDARGGGVPARMRG